MLTRAQIKAMRWLREKPNHYARWLGDDPPASWHSIRLKGRSGQITIRAEDWEAIAPYRTTVPSGQQMFGLNDAGRRALSQQEQAND